MRGDSHERSDLIAVEVAELREFAQERAANDGADAGNGAQEIFRGTSVIDAELRGA
jgi:hypothetical protein